MVIHYNIFLILIMHVYIASEPGTLFGSKALYRVIIPDSDLFPPNTHISTLQESIQRMLPLKAQNITQTHSHHALSCSHLFMDEWTSSQHDSSATPRA